MFSEGSVVICNGNDKGQLSLTIGTEYVVLSAYTSNVKIKNDIGHEAWYNSSRFTQKSAAPVKQIKLEVGKTYLTAGGYVVHITAMSPFHDNYYSTIECSPGFNAGCNTIQKVSSDREGDFRRYGWAYKPDGTIYLGNEWSEKLRIIEEFPKLKPAPQGFRYAGGFPQARPPKQNEWYMSCFGGDPIQADKDESKSLIRVIIEKEESKMPPYPSMPAGFKFASDPPEHRKPKTGEWFIGIDGHARQAESDFQSSPYYIISKISETTKEEVYPKYYEMSGPNKNDYAFRKRVSETKHRLVSHSGKESHEFYWVSRDKSIGDIELTKEVALGRINKAVAKTPSPVKVEEPAIAHKEEVYPKYYTPLNIKDWAFIKRTSPFAHFLTKYDGTEVVADVGWSKHHDALYVEIPAEVALAQIKKPTAQTPAPPKITNLCVEERADRPQSRLSYWVAEPIENMLDAAKRSARYVVASSLLAGIGYVSFNPVESFNFVSSCLPKIHIKFGK